MDEKDVVKAGMDSVFAPFADLIARLFEPSADEIGEGMRALVAGWTRKRQTRFWKREVEMISEAEFEPRAVPPKVLFSMVQNASIEDDDELQDKWAALLGVRPSNRRDSHIRSCCAPTLSVAALGDGRVGGLCPIEREERIVSPFTHRDDTT